MKCKYVVFSCATILLAATLIYTAIFFGGTDTIEKQKMMFAEKSATNAVDFAQIDSMSFAYSAYQAWAPKSDNTQQAEMFLLHQPRLFWFSASRAKLDEHFVAQEPIGYASKNLRDDHGKSIPAGFVFSPNTLKIAKISLELQNPKTGELQMQNLYSESESPLALMFALNYENMELQSIVCYNTEGNIVYSKTV